MLKAYSTKYWITKGIQEVEVEASKYNLKYFYSKAPYSTQYVLGKDLFFLDVEAVTDVQQKAAKKKVVLLKTIAKLEKKFGV